MPAEVDLTLPLPGLSPVQRKPVVVRFDGGRLSSDGGVLLLAEVEHRLRVAERLAQCLEDPRAGADRSWVGRDDPLSRLGDCRGLCRRHRLRRLAQRPGVQDGGRPPARDGRGSVFATDHDAAGEPAQSGGAQAHDGGDADAVLRQLRADAAPPRPRHRRYRGSHLRRPAVGVVQRPPRQPRLHADPHLRSDDGQAGGRVSASRQNPERPGGRPGAAPCRAPPARPLAHGRHRHPRRQPLRAARGDGVVRAPAGRLRLRSGGQRRAGAPGPR